MEYPIIISGERVGKLNVRTQGLFTVFEAEIPARTELTRLSVFGEGEQGYLGVMQPWNGGLYLRRQLSKSDMSGFPKNIEYAGAEEANSRAKPQMKAPAPEPERTNDAEDVLAWYASPTGVLTAFDGRHSLTAIPAALRRPSDAADIRNIGGKDYIVFRKY